MKVLLTGANGQLGRCFQDRLPVNWQVWATDSAELDITNRDAVLSAVEKFNPNIIINAAAYTAVDKAESDQILAALVNKTGPENLAIAAKENNSLFVHISTDYVFNGASKKPYVETDDTSPLGVYGKTKLDGERIVEKINPESIIIRTAWVFSEYGNNFVKTMLRLGKERDAISIVGDQFGCPTYAGDLADAIIQLIKLDAEKGIYHYCGDNETSWFDFAKYIFEISSNKNIITIPPVLNEILTDNYPTPAKRPRFSVLSCEKIERYGIKKSDWNKAIIHVIDKIKCA